MADVLEFRIPMTPTPGVPEDEYQFPWIDDLQEAVTELVDAGVLEEDDSAEQLDDDYVFYLTGASEDRLIAAANRLSILDQVPAGAYAITPSGERVDLGDV